MPQSGTSLCSLDSRNDRSDPLPLEMGMRGMLPPTNKRYQDVVVWWRLATLGTDRTTRPARAAGHLRLHSLGDHDERSPMRPLRTMSNLNASSPTTVIVPGI